MKLAWSPVGDASEIPFLPMTPSDRHELPWLAIENMHRVPLCRNITNKLKGRLISVSLRAVRHHLKWSLEDDIERKLLRSSAHHHGALIAGNKIVFCGTIEAAGCVIQGTGDHAGKWKDGSIYRTIASANFVVLRSQDGFV